MVLEAIISIRTAEHKPWDMFFIALGFSSIANMLAFWLFPGQASSSAILFCIIAFLPIILKVMAFEENVEEHTKKLSIRTHKRILPFFIFLFLGLFASYLAWFVLLPQELTNNLFNLQINTISSLDSKAPLDFLPHLARLLANNLQVLLVCILLSLLFGAGAIYILIWNSSVIAAAAGSIIRSELATGTLAQAFAFGTFRYLIHGIPEVFAFFLGGLAGGVISVAILKHELGTKKFNHALLDACDLVIASVILLCVAAILEIMVSPLVA